MFFLERLFSVSFTKFARPRMKAFARSWFSEVPKTAAEATGHHNLHLHFVSFACLCFVGERLADEGRCWRSSFLPLGCGFACPARAKEF